jgi:hypothetical protein
VTPQISISRAHRVGKKRFGLLNTHAAASVADTGDSKLAGFQQVRERNDDSAPGATDGVAKCDGTTADLRRRVRQSDGSYELYMGGRQFTICFGGVEAQDLLVGFGHGRKSFVDLNLGHLDTPQRGIQLAPFDRMVGLRRTAG